MQHSLQQSWEEREFAELYSDVTAIAKSNAGRIVVATEGESPVCSTLQDHLHVWEARDVSNFQIGVIRDGFKLDLSEIPAPYYERNNSSFKEELKFGIGAIKKLVEANIVSVVSQFNTRSTMARADF